MQYYSDVILEFFGFFFSFFDGKSRFKRHLSGKILRRSTTIKIYWSIWLDTVISEQRNFHQNKPVEHGPSFVCIKWIQR